MIKLMLILFTTFVVITNVGSSLANQHDDVRCKCVCTYLIEL